MRLKFGVFAATLGMFFIAEPQKIFADETKQSGYLPTFYNLENDNGMFASIEFLEWYARESNLSYAAQSIGIQKSAPVSGPPVDIGQQIALGVRVFEELDAVWDPGFRIGIGKNFQDTALDIGLNWTYYHNKSNESVSVPNFGVVDGNPVFPIPFNPFFPSVGESVLINPWSTLFFNGLDGLSAYFDTISAHWSLNLNQIDLEFGSKFWLSKALALRVYGGVRGDWIKLTFNTASSRNFTFVTSNESFLYLDNFTTHFWGVGPLGGLEPSWYLSKQFSIFSKISGALLMGNFNLKKKENYTHTSSDPSVLGNTILRPYVFDNHSQNSFFQMQAILDLAIGLRWEKNWSQNRYRSTIDLGWESHILFDTNHRSKLAGYSHPGIYTAGQALLEGSSTYLESVGNLELGGINAKFRFDF